MRENCRKNPDTLGCGENRFLDPCRENDYASIDGLAAHSCVTGNRRHVCGEERKNIPSTNERLVQVVVLAT